MKTKELTIEEKAKAYDEVLERAKELLEVGLKDTRDKRVILSFFPELAKSEDERIREKVIATIHLYYGEPLEDEAKEMIYWLEKQGEQKHDNMDNKFIRMRENKPKDISEFLDRHTTVEQEFLWEHIAKIRELDKEEQKPAWSEEDERDFDIVRGIIYNSCNAEDASRLIEWLLSLRPQKQWKPSDNELEVLRLAAEKDGTCLMGLYEQLKKLKG